jgi:hypothetical protein
MRMVIEERQLEVWSHQGAVQSSRITHQSIRNSVDNHTFPDGVQYDVFLQGSYKNSTNIRGTSDVDVVIGLTSSFQPNKSRLTEEEKAIFSNKYSDATYKLVDFRADVMETLRNHYDNSKIIEGNKAVRLEGYSGRLNADILIALQYREFFHVYENQADEFIEGIAFQTRDNVWIYSYPKQHYENGVKKMSLTHNNFKSLVRIYKNIKGKLEDNFDIPDKFITSYFIESLIYNLPNNYFSGSYSNILVGSLNWFNDADFTDFKCQDGLSVLFGSSEGQWSISDAKTFISSIIELWNNW